jgi:hypothetical protein
MAVLRRYEGQSTYVGPDGNTYSHRYKRTARGFSYTTIVTTKPTTLDYLSVIHYGTPLLFWAIADVNNYVDPMITIPEGTAVKIPHI